MLFVEADENRYEGSWKKDKKNGPGKFYYLDKGQVYEGVWLDGVPKCGEMKDFGRDHAPDATQYELPKVRYILSLLTLKHQETHGCKVSTVATDGLVLKHQAKAPGHEYPQYWLNIRFIGPVSYENITLSLDNIWKKNYILKEMTQSFKG